MKEKKRLKRFKNLNTELQSFFLKKAAILIAIIVADVLIAFCVKDWDVLLFFLVVTTIYMLWEGYFYLMAVLDRIVVFEGICEKVSVKKREFSHPISKTKSAYELYGKSSIIIAISAQNENGTVEEAKFVVPVPGNTDIEENNIVRVYALESSTFKKNDNTFEITNPIMVKTAKC